MAEADEKPLPELPPATCQVPDWETPTQPPTQSLWSHMPPAGPGGGIPRRKPVASAAAGSDAVETSRARPAANSPGMGDGDLDKETLGNLGLRPADTDAFGSAVPAAPVLPYTSDIKARLATSPAAFQARLDRLLPPDRTYFGRTRRFILLFVAVPSLLLIVLALGLGLGLGLKKKSSVYSNLPLPSAGGIHTGDLTYYNLGLGACGWTDTNQDIVCAVSHYVFDAAAKTVPGASADPNLNPLCGKKIRVERDFTEIGAGNRSVDVTVVDRCVGCKPNDLDLSPTVFDMLALQSEGRVVGSWAWLS